MSIEKNIERIANALEEIVKMQECLHLSYGVKGGVSLSTTKTEEPEKVEKPKGKVEDIVVPEDVEKAKKIMNAPEPKKKAAPKKELETNKDVSVEEARTLLQEYMLKLGNNEEASEKAKGILIDFGVSKISDLTPMQRIELKAIVEEG